ncbi:unnamed protein product [Dibothriocephalus latus]|uniref:Ig-like domain-containing protein n=1 Tax=Dibothriocephalus latus TaxID=60516 RepID=A0A3P7NPK5_DIBLA|nr:unnamed protein product [Dibothriocephalus latus]
MQPPYLARFKTPKSLMYRVPNKKLKVKDLRPTSRLLFHVVDYKFRADGWEDFNMSIGCFLTFDQQEVKEYNMSMNASVGPLMVCVPPRTLLIMPDNRFIFHKEDQLECSPTDHVFPEPTVSWHWVLGPLPESDLRPTKGNWKTFNSSILPLSSLPGPGFYVYKCTVEHTCAKKSTYGPMKHMFIISEPNKTFDIVEVRPVLAIVPEVIHFNCPSILTPTARRTSVHQEVFATSLTWFRTRRQINFTEPYNDTTYEMIVKHDFIYKNLSRPTPQFENPERIQNFRLENEVRIDFAMDIGPSSGEDYGYYGCITEISDEEKLTNGTRFVQHASQPVCLILKNEFPKLDLKVVSKKGVTTRKDCFIAEETVQVECTTPAYQTFCDDSDKPLGRTLIGSRTYLQFVYATNKLDGISYEKYPKSITLNVTSEITKSTSKPDEIPRVWLEHTKYTFKVSWRHDEAVISCHTVPLLQTYFRESPAANETFRREFERLVPIIRGSTDENMCVFYPPRNILIDPPPPDQTSREEVTFTIDRDIMITCSVDGHPLPKVDIDIYPLRISRLGIALDKGLADPDSWTDLTQAGVDWPNFPGEGNASVIVGECEADYFLVVFRLIDNADKFATVIPISLAFVG